MQHSLGVAMMEGKAILVIGQPELPPTPWCRPAGWPGFEAASSAASGLSALRCGSCLGRAPGRLRQCCRA